MNDTTVFHRLQYREPEFAELFIARLLSRNARIEEDLIHQLFNSTEKQLARILLSLAHFGRTVKPGSAILKVTPEALAVKVGSTRLRVRHFMNRFRKMGFIDYDGGGVVIHNGLLTVLLSN